MEQDWRYSMACPTDTQLLWLGSLKYGWSTVSSKNPPLQAITPRRMSQAQLGGSISREELNTLKRTVEDVDTILLTEDLRHLTLIKKHRELRAKSSGDGDTSCILCGESFHVFSLCWFVTITSCPSICHDCQNKVCRKCERQYMLKNGEVTLCAICHSRRELWKDTGAWYLGHHPAFDMGDDTLLAQLQNLQEELRMEEDVDTPRQMQLALASSDPVLSVRSPTPLQVGELAHLLETSPSPKIPPRTGKLFTFTRQLSRSLPSLNITASDSELHHITEELVPAHQQILSNSFTGHAHQKSLTLPMSNRRLTWLDSSADTLQDVRLDASLPRSRPRSVARLVRQTPSRNSEASLTGRSDLENSSTDEKEMSPSASFRENSLEDGEGEQQSGDSLTQRREDVQELRKKLVGARRHSLNKLVRKAEGLIKSISSNNSREPSPESNGNIEFSMVYNRDSKELRVTILRCKGLKAADANGLSDPYVNVYLSEGSATKQSTSVVERTLNPTFNQEFVYYGISESFVRRHDLIFIVFDYDKVSKDDFLGSATIPIRRVNHEVDIFNLSLTDEYPGNVEQYSTEDGHALVSIGYSLERHTIDVGILRAVRLRPADNKKLSANPFAKITLSNVDGEVSKKTAVHHMTLNPEFNEEFEFPLEGMKLEKMALKISVSHRSSRNRTTHLCEASLDSLLYAALKSKSTQLQDWIALQYSKR